MFDPLGRSPFFPICAALVACSTTEATPQPSSLRVVPAPNLGLVLVATWETDVACQGQAMVRIAGGAWKETSIEPEAGRDHRRLLLNLPGDTDVEVEARCHADGEIVSGGAATARTGSVPSELTDFQLTGTPESTDKLTLLPIIGAMSAATMLNSEGRVVWYWLGSPENDNTRMVLSIDGQSVLINRTEQSSEPNGGGRIQRVSLDGELIEEIVLPLNNHDFVELPDGTIAAIVDDVRFWPELGSVIGSKIVEVSVGGEQITVWSSFDTLDPVENPARYDHGKIWTHANALDYDATTDSYWISLRLLDAILQIDRESGSVMNSIGGDAPTWAYTDPDDVLHGQHQFQLLGDSILVFDNQFGREFARAIELEIDHANKLLRRRWEWRASPPISSIVFGDVERDTQGRTRVTHAFSGFMVMVGQDGVTEWELNSPFGLVYGYTQRVGPLTEPG